jgi:GNAT superfamily N-acetyltransferase
LLVDKRVCGDVLHSCHPERPTHTLRKAASNCQRVLWLKGALIRPQHQLQGVARTLMQLLEDKRGTGHVLHSCHPDRSTHTLRKAASNCQRVLWLKGAFIRPQHQLHGVARALMQLLEDKRGTGHVLP